MDEKGLCGLWWWWFVQKKDESSKMVSTNGIEVLKVTLRMRWRYYDPAIG